MTIEPMRWQPPEVRERGSFDVLLVQEGRLEHAQLPRDVDAGSEAVRELIGNYFTSCFNVDGLVGYCDDEFLLADPDTIDRNWNVLLEAGALREEAYPIGGPIVITGVTAEGETRSLTPEEAARFSIDTNRGFAVQVDGRAKYIPMLCYRKA